VDSRVRVVHNDVNRGLIYTLNRGVALARGSFIARIDADDVAEPERIEEQVRYFAAFPDSGLVSSDFTYIGIDGQPLSARPRFQFSDAILRFLLFFVNPICHSTLIGRRELFLKHPYSTQAKHAEDFELWHRMAAEGV